MVTIIPPGTESDAEYHNSGHWGSTMINEFLRSPERARMRILEDDEKDSRALTFGRAFHALFDGTFDTKFVATDMKDRRSKAWRDHDDGREPLTYYEAQDLGEMAARVKRNTKAKSLLAGAQYEIGFRMVLDEVPVQCRADIYRPGEWIADLKTTRNVDDFLGSVMRYGYHLQAALYQDIIAYANDGQLLPFSFIVSEKEKPYRCRVFEMDPKFIELGRQRYKAALREIARRTKDNDWTEDEWALLEAPRWAGMEEIA